MTESDSEVDGYFSSDSQSDFDEADTRASRASLAPIASTSSAGPTAPRPSAGAHVQLQESDSDDESSRTSGSSTDEVRIQYWAWDTWILYPNYIMRVCFLLLLFGTFCTKFVEGSDISPGTGTYYRSS